MAIWRPVSGSITRLDPTLASVEQIEDFFAERRIIARGAVSGEDGYRVELAVTGRRRRVATLLHIGANIGNDLVNFGVLRGFKSKQRLQFLLKLGRLSGEAFHGGSFVERNVEAA